MVTFVFGTALLCAGAGLILAASLHDVAARTIPNALPLLLALTGAAAGFLGGHALASLAAGGGVFAVAALCWRLGWLGGGDVKLLGAAAMAVSPGMVPAFIASVAIVGGALAALYLLLRRVMPRPGRAKPRGLLARAVRAEQWRARRGGPLPYACAIAGGFLFAVL